jgi:hypothetical protein
MSQRTRTNSCLRTGKARALALAILLTGFHFAAHATILTFDQTRLSGSVVPAFSGGNVQQDYGDRVTGSPMTVSGGAFTYGNDGEGYTPNVVVDILGGSATAINPAVGLWADQYGDLANVVIGNNNSLSINVRLTADTGFEALLYGFDLAGWPSTDYTIGAVRVSEGGVTLYSQSNVLVEGNATGPGHTSFEFATPLSGNDLVLQVDYGNLPGGQHDNIGIDNIRFGQNPPAPIPEPATGAFIGVGLAALAAWRRRVLSLSPGRR